MPDDPLHGPLSVDFSEIVRVARTAVARHKVATVNLDICLRDPFDRFRSENHTVFPGGLVGDAEIGLVTCRSLSYGWFISVKTFHESIVGILFPSSRTDSQTVRSVILHPIGVCNE